MTSRGTKSVLCLLLILVGFFSLMFQGNINSYAQITTGASIGLDNNINLASTTGSVICSIVSAGTTTITAAIDGQNRPVCQNGSSGSTTIVFSFRSSVNVAGFECSIDSQAVSSCSSPAPYSNLASGTGHVFTVRSSGDTSPATFRWTISGTITNNLVPSAAAQLSDQQVANSIAAQQAQQSQVSNAATIGAATQNAQVQQENTDAAAVSATLNPPLSQCQAPPLNADLAIYKIQGHANLKRLVENINQNDRQNLPVTLFLYEDTNPGPGDLKNLIVDHNNPFIIGKLVVFPGVVNKQHEVNFEIDKISTDCKITTLINQQEILGVRTNKGEEHPSILIANRADPPFQICKQPDSTTKLATAFSTPSSPSAQTSAVVSLQSGAQIFTGAADTGGKQTNPLLENDGPSDVAKYIIRGIIDVTQLTALDDSTPILFTIVNDLAAYAPPEQKPFQVKDSNNQFAASVQINPGNTADWQGTFFELREISTECKEIPFVSKPMAIGAKDRADFFPDPTSVKFGKPSK